MLMRLSKATLAFPCRALIRSNFARVGAKAVRSSGSYRGYAGSMDEAATNAPLFIEAFYDACEHLRQQNPEMALPDIVRINRILSDAGAGYQIDPPNLFATRVHVPITVPEQAPSLDAQAQALIEQALAASQHALSEGNGRQ